MPSLWQELPIELWRQNSKRDSWRLGGEERRGDFGQDFVEFMEEEIINR